MLPANTRGHERPRKGTAVTEKLRLHRTTADDAVPTDLDPELAPPADDDGGSDRSGISRRAVLRVGAGGAAALGIYGALGAMPGLTRQGLLSPNGGAEPEVPVAPPRAREREGFRAPAQAGSRNPSRSFLIDQVIVQPNIIAWSSCARLWQCAT